MSGKALRAPAGAPPRSWNGEPKVELTLSRAAWYDGRSVTLLDKEHTV